MKYHYEVEKSGNRYRIFCVPQGRAPYLSRVFDTPEKVINEKRRIERTVGADNLTWVDKTADAGE